MRRLAWNSSCASGKSSFPRTCTPSTCLRSGPSAPPPPQRTRKRRDSKSQGHRSGIACPPLPSFPLINTASIETTARAPKKKKVSCMHGKGENGEVWALSKDKRVTTQAEGGTQWGNLEQVQTYKAQGFIITSRAPVGSVCPEAAGWISATFKASGNAKAHVWSLIQTLET